jgi:hypothetical protein
MSTDPTDPTDKPSPAQIEEEFQQFIFDMSEMLEALHELAARGGVGPLDGSYESLDRLESLVALVLDGKLALPDGARSNQLVTTAARYVGETVIRRIGGRWSYAKSPAKAHHGQPLITEIPGLPSSYELLPLNVVRGYQRSRRAGWLRREVETHDLAALRARAATFDRDMAGELEALAQDVEARRPGTYAAPALDFSVESLDGLERVLADALDDNPREVGRLADRIARYMGEILRRRVGGDWQLVDDPGDGNFGDMRVHGFAPRSVVRNFELRRQPGLLAQAMRSVLARTTGAR